MHKTPAEASAQEQQLIHQSSIFLGVNVEDVDHLIADCNLLSISAGETLLEANTKNDYCNIILSGAMRVYLDDENNEQFISLTTGDCVGELSIFDGTNTSAKVVAENESVLLRIQEETLWRLVRASHIFSRNLLLMLAKRLRNDNSIIINGLRYQHELENLANIDGLTGLYNRRWMNEYFKRQINRAKSDKKPLVLMLADLDHFKKVNDLYGHVVGDEVLSSVASVLPHQFRPTDLLARFGGEEFAMILPNTPTDMALKIAERVRGAIASTRVEFYPEIQLTLSLGVATLRPDDDMNSLLSRADHALYQAKENGRNRVEIS